MKKIKLIKVITTVVLFLASWSASFAQPQGAKFRLVYNACTQTYEVYLITTTPITLVNTGSGTALQVGPSSVSIVIPAVVPGVPNGFNPDPNNLDPDPMDPSYRPEIYPIGAQNGGSWNFIPTRRFNPASAPGSSFYYVITTGSNILFPMTPILPAGRVIRLFRFRLGNPINGDAIRCVPGVRLFRNFDGNAMMPCSGVNLNMQWPDITEELSNTPDPCSGDLGGANYNNAFQINSAQGEIYRGNIGNFGTTCGLTDYGDLPSNYPQARATNDGYCDGFTPLNSNIPPDGIPNGPTTAVWAGARIDGENIQAFSNSANGDNNTDFNDEDGLTPPATSLNYGFTYNFGVTVNSITPRTVHYGLWFDWNNDGAFDALDVDGNGVRAFYSGAVPTMSPATVQVPVKTPQNTGGISFNAYKIRLIVSDAPLAVGMSGATIAFGEIEDYLAPAEILPVTFGDVNAVAKNCTINVTFDYLTQQNNKEFRIEYSTTGTNWKELAILPNVGNISSQRYSFVHASPVSGANYYRVKQIDFDGNSTYSKIASATSTCEGKNRIVSYPNPVRESLTVVLPLTIGKSQLKITDAAGKTVSNTTTQNAFNTINTQMLATGMYMLQVVNAEKIIYTTKFVKE